MNLGIIENILYIIYAIICVAIIIITFVQRSEQEAGASQAIMGSSSNSNFFDKNKGRTGEAKLKKWTIILGIIFALLSGVLSVIALA